MKGDAMLSLRALGALAAAAALSVAVPASSLAANTSGAHAHAAGGGETTLVYPSLVNTRLVRAQAALDRAAKYSDQGLPEKAIADLTAARNNLSKAWSGAKYVIQTTPAPPAEEASVFHHGAFMKSGRLRIYKKNPHAKSVKKKTAGKGGQRVHKAGGAVGPTPATPYDTAFAVLSLQHYAATTTVGLIDESTGTSLLAVRSTLARSLNDRDAAIAFIHSVDTKPPAEEEEGEEEEAASWSTTMPNAIPQLNDEIQQAKGTLAEPNLTGAETSILQGAQYRDLKTARTLNLYWPPPPPEEE
jgi:hypothetical protein